MKHLYCCINFLPGKLKICWKWLFVIHAFTLHAIRHHPLMGVAMYKSELHLTICSVLQEQAPTTPNAPVVIPKAPFSKGQAFVYFLLGRNARHSVNCSALNPALFLFVCLRCMGGWSWAGNSTFAQITIRCCWCSEVSLKPPFLLNPSDRSKRNEGFRKHSQLLIIIMWVSLKKLLSSFHGLACLYYVNNSTL